MITVCPICKRELEMDSTNFYRSRAQGRGFDHYCKNCRKRGSRGAWAKVSKKAKDRKNYRKKFDLGIRTTSLMAAYRKYDTKHKMVFGLDKTSVMALLATNCIYCGEGLLHKLGLDRLDNKKGHTLNNVVTCCDECNTARSDHFTYEEMLKLGKGIAAIKHDRIMDQCPGTMWQCQR